MQQADYRGIRQQHCIFNFQLLHWPVHANTAQKVNVLLMRDVDKWKNPRCKVAE